MCKFSSNAWQLSDSIPDTRKGKMMWKITVLLVVIHCLGVVSPFENLCPAIEDIQPCYCVSDGQNIRVDCISVTSVEDVRKALSSTKGIKRVHIDFQRAKIDHIPSDLFKGLDLVNLSFNNCDLKSFGDEGRSILEGLENIIEELAIHFSFSEENELKFLNVSGLKALEFLTIEGNELTKLGNEWFQDGPINVKSLFIMTNRIEELGDKAFQSLVNVKNLWLTGNRFKILKRSMLPSPARNLVSLDLTDNGISSLPEDMFTNMPVLKEVILADNGITRIPEVTWSSIWKQITRVYLELNPLECDNHIDWMFKIERPYVVKGQCVAPIDRKNQDLKRIIDDNTVDSDEIED